TGGKATIYIGQDPNLVGPCRRADDRRRIVRTSASEGGGAAFVGGAAIPRHHGHGATIKNRQQRAPAAGAGGRVVRGSVAKVVIGDDNVLGAHKAASAAHLFETSCKDPRRDLLAQRDQRIGGLRAYGGSQGQQCLHRSFQAAKNRSEKLECEDQGLAVEQIGHQFAVHGIKFA